MKYNTDLLHISFVFLLRSPGIYCIPHPTNEVTSVLGSWPQTNTSVNSFRAPPPFITLRDIGPKLPQSYAEANRNK